MKNVSSSGKQADVFTLPDLTNFENLDSVVLPRQAENGGRKIPSSIKASVDTPPAGYFFYYLVVPLTSETNGKDRMTLCVTCNTKENFAEYTLVPENPHVFMPYRATIEKSLLHKLLTKVDNKMPFPFFGHESDRSVLPDFRLVDADVFGGFCWKLWQDGVWITLLAKCSPLGVESQMYYAQFDIEAENDNGVRATYWHVEERSLLTLPWMNLPLRFQKNGVVASCIRGLKLKSRQDFGEKQNDT